MESDPDLSEANATIVWQATNARLLAQRARNALEDAAQRKKDVDYLTDTVNDRGRRIGQLESENATLRSELSQIRAEVEAIQAERQREQAPEALDAGLPTDAEIPVAQVIEVEGLA